MGTFYFSRDRAKNPREMCQPKSQMVEAIRTAIETRDYEMLSTLLAGQDAKELANQVDDEGISPLFLALNQRPAAPRLVRALLEAGADISYTRVVIFPPVRFLDGFEGELLERALELHPELKLEDELEEEEVFYEHSFQKAISTGCLEIIRRLSSTEQIRVS